MGRGQAIEIVLRAFVDTAGALPEITVSRIFGWHSTETLRAADSLIEAGMLYRGRFRGDRKTWLVSPEL
jgi:hypothetical protein